MKNKGRILLYSTLLTALMTTPQVIVQTANAEAPSSKILSPKELKKIEERVQDELKGTNLSTEKKFFLNLLAGRELYQYRFFDKASQYYRNAIAMNIDENKTEAYINLMAIAIDKGDKEKVRALYKETLDYFTRNSQFKTKEIDYYLSTIENYLPGKSSEKNPPKVEGFYGRFAHEENLINLIKEKNYEKAFSLLNPDGVARSTSDFNITVYDALNVVLKRKNAGQLYCSKQYKQYPNSFAMSTIVCSLLTDYMEKGKFEDKHVKTANLYFKENPEKQYIYELVNELNEKK